MSLRRSALVVLSLAAVLAVSPVLADGGDGRTGAAPKSEPSAAPPAAEPGAKAVEEPLVHRRVPAPKSLRQAMARLGARRVSVDFKEMEFERAVRFVSNVADFDVIVSPALQKEGAADIAPLTLKLNDVTLKRLVELMADFTKTSYVLREGILEFTTKADARGKPVLRIYSVQEITQPLRNFPGPDINLRPSGADFEDEPESDVESAFDSDAIVDLIQRTVDPETWEDDATSISAYTGRLVIKTYPEVHRKIARLLAELRAHR